MTDYIKIAKRMLGLEENENLPKELQERLDEVNALCEFVDGGALRSRQAIAVVIEQWGREDINIDIDGIIN